MKQSVSGFVFSGGHSSRFGTNKMFHLIDGKPMGLVVFDNLKSAIQTDTFFVGPEINHPSFVDIPRVIGNREGQGPLGAICDVLEMATTELVVFAPCDTPYFLTEQFQCLAESSGEQGVVVSADVDGPHLRHWLLSCWNVSLTRNHMISAYESGERAIHRAVVGLSVFEQYFSAQQLTNINTPSVTQ
jgi:molybdopterin-guanine dinucleotide biosynthesis protein A